tara:strand:+ start:623 stop:898 length:276 start_codon:yes stop_codon:yes gene_type:complete
MVVGDIVSAVYDTTTIMEFRPAAGVGIAITILQAYAINIELTDGTANGLIANGTPNFLDMSTTKVMITNSIWLKTIAPSAQGSVFTGIQIQ